MPDKVTQDLNDMFYNSLGDETESENAQELIHNLREYIKTLCEQ